MPRVAPCSSAARWDRRVRRAPLTRPVPHSRPWPEAKASRMSMVRISRRWWMSKVRPRGSMVQVAPTALSSAAAQGFVPGSAVAQSLASAAVPPRAAAVPVCAFQRRRIPARDPAALHAGPQSASAIAGRAPARAHLVKETAQSHAATAMQQSQDEARVVRENPSSVQNLHADCCLPNAPAGDLRCRNTKRRERVGHTST